MDYIFYLVKLADQYQQHENEKRNVWKQTTIDIRHAPYHCYHCHWFERKRYVSAGIIKSMHKRRKGNVEGIL